MGHRKAGHHRADLVVGAERGGPDFAVAEPSFLLVVEPHDLSASPQGVAAAGSAGRELERAAAEQPAGGHREQHRRSGRAGAREGVRVEERAEIERPPTHFDVVVLPVGLRDAVADHLHRLAGHRPAEPLEPVRRHGFRLGGGEVPVEPGPDDELDALEGGKVVPDRDGVANLGGSRVLVSLHGWIVPEVLDESSATLGYGDDIPYERPSLEVRVVQNRSAFPPGVGAVEDHVSLGSEDEEIDGAGFEVPAVLSQHRLPLVRALEPDLPDELGQPANRALHELPEGRPVHHVGGGQRRQRDVGERLAGM